MNEEKINEMVDSTIRYLYQSARASFPRSIYFHELIEDENLNDKELEILANQLEKDGVVVDSKGEMELEKFIDPRLIESRKANRPDKWWIALSKEKRR